MHGEKGNFSHQVIRSSLAFPNFCPPSMGSLAGSQREILQVIPRWVEAGDSQLEYRYLSSPLGGSKISTVLSDVL